MADRERDRDRANTRGQCGRSARRWKDDACCILAVASRPSSYNILTDDEYIIFHEKYMIVSCSSGVQARPPARANRRLRPCGARVGGRAGRRTGTEGGRQRACGAAPVLRERDRAMHARCEGGLLDEVRRAPVLMSRKVARRAGPSTATALMCDVDANGTS